MSKYERKKSSWKNVFSTFMQYFMGITCQDNNAQIYYTELYPNTIGSWEDMYIMQIVIVSQIQVGNVKYMNTEILKYVVKYHVFA